ncbi:NAD-dependent epimerase [Mucilaginibacter conchicola]|uniref:NAD-dependent epimerase n=1 Tax=Mucilaginibacter conchicola TaxID=2303333 RepID=A0A372P0X4_9SPHI|nr:NAD-dependent epimerase [Mucilaginibacter conchicola]RFZ95377.1 NAD-dependent epimerase [Mucilaginibacter conchicola]
MKVLVTGAAGFIGYHLSKQLLERGDEVIGLDNINDYYDVNLKYSRLQQLGIERELIEEGKLVESAVNSNFKFVKQDLESEEFISQLFKDNAFDAVVNLAAQAGVRYSIENPKAYIKSNVEGFLNILEACRNYPVKHLVYASSSSVYGANTKMPFHVQDPVNHPVSVYAATKRSNELLAHTYSHLFNISTTGLRFFTVYGPWGRPDMAPMLFADAVLNGRAIKVFNNGNMQRDFTYVKDIVNGVIAVLDKPATPNPEWNGDKPDSASSTAPYRIYNIGNSKPVKLMDFISAMENALGTTANKNFMEMQPGDVLATWADVDNLKHDVGYSPSTLVDEGVNEFILWYKEYYK